MKFNSEFLLAQQKSSKLDLILLAICFCVTIMIPGIKISDTFYLSLEEVIIPLLALRLLQKLFLWIDWLVITLLIFMFVVILSILLNVNRLSLNEYFEAYKVGKFLIIYLFTFYCFYSKQMNLSVDRFVRLAFAFIVLFNTMHYFDVFGFNNYVTILYDTNGIDLQYFGRNSEGGVGAKRIIGTMGNPNINAILFLFFFSYFMDQTQKQALNISRKKMNQLLMLLSAALIVLCQSRTGLVALSFLILLSWYFRSFSLKDFTFEILTISGFYFLIRLGDPNSVQYISNTSVNPSNSSGIIQENNSLKGRKEIWLYLIEMWKEKPILGYGPNKNFMYANKLHPESQYIFYLWRYGVIGFFGLLTWLFMPLIMIRKHIKNYLLLVFSSIVIFITGLMSNPLDNTKVAFIYAVVLGYSMALFYSSSINNKKEEYVE